MNDDIPCACDESPVDYDHNYPDCKITIRKLRDRVNEMERVIKEILDHIEVYHDPDSEAYEDIFYNLYDLVRKD
jgi:hypothetical protein